MSRMRSNMSIVSPPERLGHRVTSPGTYASRRWIGTLSAHGRMPNTEIDPESVRSRPSSARMVVDLPAPLGPRKPCTSPAATLRSRPSSARVAPKVLTRSWMSMTGSLTLFTIHKIQYFLNIVTLRSMSRASRRPSASAADPSAVAARFVERMGGALTDAGLPRLPSRVFAALVIDDDGRMTAAELAETLAVSPAAVSGAVNFLAQIGFLHRERERGSRKDVYVVDDDAWLGAMMRKDQTYAPMMTALDGALGGLRAWAPRLRPPTGCG